MGISRLSCGEQHFLSRPRSPFGWRSSLDRHHHHSLDDVPDVSLEPNTRLLALDEALKALAEIDPEQSRIVELRYFGGLTIEETAEVMKTSPATIKREWAMARAWLHQALTNNEPAAPPSI
jgi:RNA polymerase sigma factor (TIGR02999 family)